MSTRRQFIKTIAAASAFLAVRPIAQARNFVNGGVWTARVIRCSCFLDLQGAFLDDPDAGPCPRCQVGQQWKFTAGLSPDGICPKLWRSISEKIEMIECHHDLCAKEAADPKGWLVSCADPTRPVIVSLRRLS